MCEINGHQYIQIQDMLRKLFLSLICIIIVTSFSLSEEKSTLAPYNRRISEQYVYFAVLSYCPKKCIEQWSCKGQKQTLVQVKHFMEVIARAAAYIGYSPSRDMIVISYRGSSNIQNWIQDFTFDKIPYKYCQKCEIHQGFYNDYKSIETGILGHLKTLMSKYPKAKILATGHSLGGALATIAAIQIKRLYPSLSIEVHHYGCPRIGNSHLAKYINQKIQNIYRVVHYKDIVPHLPPDSIQFGFHHPAYEIFFNQDFTTYKVCNDSGQDMSCSNQFVPKYDPNDHGFYFFDLGKVQC